MSDEQPLKGPRPLDIEAIADDDPHATLAQVVEELHGDLDADGVMMVGVGPLESLLHQGHGEELWPELARLIRTDKIFRQALRATWAYSSPEYERREALLAAFAEEDGINE
jgi:hypothetical protein